jgi:hypothetical protein
MLLWWVKRPLYLSHNGDHPNSALEVQFVVFSTAGIESCIALGTLRVTGEILGNHQFGTADTAQHRLRSSFYFGPRFSGMVGYYIVTPVTGIEFVTAREPNRNYVSLGVVVRTARLRVYVNAMNLGSVDECHSVEDSIRVQGCGSSTSSPSA